MQKNKDVYQIEFESGEAIGRRTKRLLDESGVVSPSINGMLEIKKGTWIVPKTKIDDDFEELKFKERMKAKFKL
jgi:hypothetical protein